MFRPLVVPVACLFLACADDGASDRETVVGDVADTASTTRDDASGDAASETLDTHAETTPDTLDALDTRDARDADDADDANDADDGATTPETLGDTATETGADTGADTGSDTTADDGSDASDVVTACDTPVVLAERDASVFDQLLVGPMPEGTLTGPVTFEVEPVLSQFATAYGFGFDVASEVSAIDVRFNGLASAARDLEVIVGARLHRTFGSHWSRQAVMTTWTTVSTPIEVRYTPQPPYVTGPISAGSANETSFGISLGLRSAAGQETMVLVMALQIRLVLKDGSVTEWRSPSGGNLETDVGWNDLQRLAAADGSSAGTDSAPNLSGTRLVRATGYGMALDAGATVTGVELRWSGHRALAWEAAPRVVRLVADGATLGTDQADGQVLAQTDFAPVGGPAALWGADALSVATLNRADFGVEVSLFAGGTSGSGNIFLDALTLVVWGCP